MKKVHSFKLHLFFFLTVSLISCAQDNILQEEKSFDYGTTIISLEPISESERLTSSVKRLHDILKNKNKKGYKGSDSVFTILHIGDSHIQGDYFTSVIRKQLQNYFGNAGQGILFPYATAQSYGPKGLEVKTKGKWKGVKTMTQNLTYDLGLSGYGVFINNTNCSLSVTLNEKFDVDLPLSKFAPVQKINIWHTAGPGSFLTSLDDNFKLVDKKLFPSGWGVSTYFNENKTNGFTIIPENTNGGQYYYGFYGFELLPLEQRGISYHHCGVVGAQFTHLIKNAKLAMDQLKLLKPDIIVFSFGTNEAYNGNFDTDNYIRVIKNFILEINKISPGTAIIFTTAPDTRSQGKTPPHQINVNKALMKIADETSSSIYDLNTAMGGWGSMNTWFSKQLTLKDKLHFNTDGYAIQGKLFALALLEFYNKKNSSDTLNLNQIRKSIDQSMRILSRSKQVHQINEQNDSTKTTVTDSASIDKNHINHDIKKVKDKKNDKLSSKEKKKVHVVKKGDTLSKIARIYKVSINTIAKMNGIPVTKVLRLGQKLIIPRK
ncbi:MAG: LysM peptidoglycan-binding domain-containing protein [Bacteroidota bacterium]